MAEKNVILKNSIGDVLYPKIAYNSVTVDKIVDKAVTTSKIADGSISKEKLDDVVKQKIDGIVITLNYSGRPGEYELGESSLSSFSDLETYYNAYNQGVNIYFVINSVGHGHGFNTSSTNYLPVYEFGYDSRRGYTLMAKDDLFIYTANSINESPYLTVTTSTATAEPKDFSVTTDKILNRAVTKEKLSKDVLEDVTSITWHELKQLRDGNNLLPGHQYRITDYQCTTTQEDTQSARHQFDIIVTADSTNKLNEKARACLHDGDTYFKDSNLSAWQLWYCLDNDTNRFSWASTYISIMLLNTPPSHINLPLASTTVIDGVTYYYWNYTGYSYMTSKDPASLIVGDSIYYNTSEANTAPASVYQNQSTITYIEKPTGVIYRMIDEWNNDCPYDFKNIQFRRWKITKASISSMIGKYYSLTDNTSLIGWEVDSSDSKYFYTFSYLGKISNLAEYKGDVLEDASIIGNTIVENTGVYNNSIKDATDSHTQQLNNIVFFTFSSTNNMYHSCYLNSFNNDCARGSIGPNCYLNQFGNNCSTIFLDDDCQFNSFTDCSYIFFGADCSANVGKDGLIYMFNSNCTNNLIWGSAFIMLGHDCDFNMIKYSGNNTFGNYCQYNVLENSGAIKLQDYYKNNKFDTGTKFITFNGNGTESSYIQNYHIKQGMIFDEEYTITAKPGLNYVLSVAKRSDGTVVEYNEADTHKLVSITDSDYTALTTKDSNTLYCIPE